MSKSILEIDEVDKKIIGLLQENPNLTHTEIASRVNRSQPTVGVRIKKLEDLGIIKFQAGINLKSSSFYIGWLDLQTKFPEKVYAKVSQCPFVINALKRSGENNVCVMLAAPELDFLDHVVNHHFRNDPDFHVIEFDIITDVMKNIVLPVDTNFESCECLVHLLH